jgi:hypothetical protein
VKEYCRVSGSITSQIPASVEEIVAVDIYPAGHFLFSPELGGAFS